MGDQKGSPVLYSSSSFLVERNFELRDGLRDTASKRYLPTVFLGYYARQQSLSLGFASYGKLYSEMS